MEILHIHEKQLKEVTLFLIDKKLIFHPIISPKGYPDFTGRYGRENILIIDRNIMTKLIEFCRAGILRDEFIRKTISGLIFWAHFNKISITGGVSLNEYAIAKGTNTEASLENNIFLKMFDQYPIQLWLDIFEGKTSMIPSIELDVIKSYEFYIENGHYKMHLAEMYHLLSLYFDSSKTAAEKVIDFLSWVNDNLLFCAYSVVYACMLFSQQIKQLNVSIEDSFQILQKKCSNQAWDLTYLSFWSTLYWDEQDGNVNHLFATMDSDLKKVFINSHDTSTNLFIRFFGKKLGAEIDNIYQRIIGTRITPKMNDECINLVLNEEKNRLLSKLII